MAAKTAEKKSQSRGFVRYLISVTGQSPMLQNPMTDATLDTLIFGAAGTRKSKQQPDVTVEDIAMTRLCLGPNGEFGVPANYLFSALVDAGRHVIYDKKTKLSTRESSLVPSLLSIIPDLINTNGDGFLAFKDQDVKWIADKRRGVLAANGAAVGIIRPKFPTWAFDVTVEVNEDLVNIDKVKELFKAAGLFSGLGDYRPSKRGPFGRFTVAEFVEVEQEAGIKQAA